MNAGLTDKRVLIISDHDALSKAIALNLNHNLDVKVSRFEQSTSGQQEEQIEMEDCDLILATVLSPAPNQLVALSRNSLIGRSRQIPLLIISDIPFHSEPDSKTVFMNFPFDIAELHHKVKEILKGTL